MDLGPPLHLLGSLPQSAEGNHRSQEKQGHSLGEGKPELLLSPAQCHLGPKTVHIGARELVETQDSWAPSLTSGFLVPVHLGEG